MPFSPSGHWAQSYFFRLAIKVALQMKTHRANNVSGDVTPCFSQPDWRPAALRASCVFFNLISWLLLKPKLLSVLVIARMNRLRRVSMPWWMPPLITIKVSAAGGKWLLLYRQLRRHGRRFSGRQQQAGHEGILYNICAFRWGSLQISRENLAAEWTVSLK